MIDPKTSQRVFDALDLEALPAEEQEEVLLTMGQLVFKDTLVRCLEAMSSTDRAAFAELAADDASADDIAAFLVARVPDADRLAGEALADLAGDILSVTNA
jgi:hypothetical protein